MALPNKRRGYQPYAHRYPRRALGRRPQTGLDLGHAGMASLRELEISSVSQVEQAKPYIMESFRIASTPDAGRA